MSGLYLSSAAVLRRSSYRWLFMVGLVEDRSAVLLVSLTSCSPAPRLSFPRRPQRKNKPVQHGERGWLRSTVTASPRRGCHSCCFMWTLKR